MNLRAIAGGERGSGRNPYAPRADRHLTLVASAELTAKDIIKKALGIQGTVIKPYRNSYQAKPSAMLTAMIAHGYLIEVDHENPRKLSRYKVTLDGMVGMGIRHPSLGRAHPCNCPSGYPPCYYCTRSCSKCEGAGESWVVETIQGVKVPTFTTALCDHCDGNGQEPDDKPDLEEPCEES